MVMMRRFIIDIDDTVNCLLESWLEAYYYIYKDFVSPKDIKSWNIAQYLIEATEKEVFEILETPHFFLNIPPKDRAISVIKRLSENGNKVTFATACSNPNIMIDKQIWLNKFMDINKKNICFTFDKSILCGDIMIDDLNTNMSNFNGVRILFSAPHNLTLTPDEDGFDLRVDSWWELEELLLGDKQYVIDDLLKTK